MTYDLEATTRRTRRKLRFWRVVAVVAVVILIAVLLLPRDDASRPHIARLSVEGLIVRDEARNRAILDLADSQAKALIVHIDSPGGTVVGGEDILRHIERVRGDMPVVAVMATVATSAGYMVALSGDRIFARDGTLTGSIGVLIQTTDMTDLLAKIGVSAEAIKSSPLKAQPSPLEPLTDEGRGALQAIIDDMYSYFVGLVAEHRPMTLDEARALADGRVYTGRQALALGLIDAIGTEVDAVAWLAETHGLDPDLPIVELDVERDDDFTTRLLGRFSGKSFFSNTLTLDGLVSLWQPEAP